MGNESDTAPLMSPVVHNVPYQPVAPQPTSYAVYPSGYPAQNVVYQNGQPVVYASHPMPSYSSAPQQVIYVQSAPSQSGPYHGHATAALILYILSTVGIWICALPSIAISLQLVAHKVIPRDKRAAVIVCSIFELIAFAFVPSFVWYGQTVCHYYYSYYYSDSWCYYNWMGWIAIVIWWGFTIACGIPRIIYTYGAKNNLPESF